MVCLRALLGGAPVVSYHVDSRCVCIQACFLACSFMYQDSVGTCDKALTPFTCAGQAA